MIWFVTCGFAGTFVRGVKRRRGVLLGIQQLWTSDVFFYCETFLIVLFSVADGLAGEMYLVDNDVFVCAAWRRLHDRSKHARGCCWAEQRRSDGCFGRGKIVCDCCVADACVRAATLCWIAWVVVTWRLDIG